MAKIEIQQWDPHFLRRSPIFDELQPLLRHHSWDNWPSCDQLNELLPPAAQNDQQQQIRFIPQLDAMDELYYEEWIYERGLCPTRIASWHDFFNAIIWCLFPQTKRELNAQHVADIASHGRQGRTRRRDALTMFDECGVVVPCSDPRLIEQLREHQWHSAFVDQRAAWGHSIDAMMIGHANYEKALSPYIGFTGKAFYVEVTPAFFEMSRPRQYQYLDQYLSELMSSGNVFEDNSQLFPLPLLGIPGWYDANQDPAFYQNSGYFRPRRRHKG